jgi:hypothetical protein
MRRARLGLAVLAALALLAAGTFVAGEQTEVVVLRTFDPDGTPHETRMWVIDVGGVPWVRVASARRGWYQRLLAEPRVELVRGGRAEPRLARPSTDPTVSRAVDEAFAQKYGLVDAWYGLLLRHDPVPIRLEPSPPPEPAAPVAGASAPAPRRASR